MAFSLCCCPVPIPNVPTGDTVNACHTALYSFRYSAVRFSFNPGRENRNCYSCNFKDYGAFAKATPGRGSRCDGSPPGWDSASLRACARRPGMRCRARRSALQRCAPGGERDLHALAHRIASAEQLERVLTVAALHERERPVRRAVAPALRRALRRASARRCASSASSSASMPTRSRALVTSTGTRRVVPLMPARRSADSAAFRSAAARCANGCWSPLFTTSTSGISMMPALMNCSTSPDPGCTTRHTRVDHVLDLGLALPDADRLDQHAVVGRRQHRRPRRSRRARARRVSPAVASERTNRPWSLGIEVHARAVAEQRAARAHARGIDREHADASCRARAARAPSTEVSVLLPTPGGPVRPDAHATPARARQHREQRLDLRLRRGPPVLDQVERARDRALSALRCAARELGRLSCDMRVGAARDQLRPGRP